MPPRRYLLAALVIASAAALLVVTFGHGRDQGIYAAVGRAILDGGAPYRDAFDFKPPGIHLVFALAELVFGAGERAIRLVEGLCLVLTAGLLVDLSWRWWRAPGVGLLAASLASLSHVQLDFWHTAQPETFGGMAMIVALRAAWRGPRSSLPSLVLSGLFFGVAALMKPPLGAGAIVVAAWIAPRGWAGVTTVVGAALVPIAGCLAWLGAAGALPAAYEIFTVVAPGYTALAWKGEHPATLFLAALARWPSATSGAIVVGLVLASVGWRSLRRRRASAVLAGIALLQLAGIAAQAKLFAYHYAGLGPVAALLAAQGWWWAASRSRAIRPLAAASCAVLSILYTATPSDLRDGFWRRSARRIALVTSSSDGAEAAWHDLASVAGVNAADHHRLAAVLREQTPPSASVFLWGFEPRVYRLADRRPASVYLYDVPQRIGWFAEPSRSRLMVELAQSPPAAIVVEHGDVFPWVTGDDLDSAAALETFPRLRELIATSYRHVVRVGPFDVHLRRGSGHY
jgi:hypothetical protein